MNENQGIQEDFEWHGSRGSRNLRKIRKASRATKYLLILDFDIQLALLGS